MASTVGPSIVPMEAPPLHPHDVELPGDRGDCESVGEGELDYSDYYESSSDDELDWDPDRERLIRFVRQTQGSGSSRRSGFTGGERQKSLAERRNEWRQSRGLERRKTVQEMLAERRALREQQGGTAAPPHAAVQCSAGGGAPTQPSAHSASGGLVSPRYPVSASVADPTTDAPVSSCNIAADTCMQSVGNAGDESNRGKTRVKLGWPWRGGQAG